MSRSVRVLLMLVATLFGVIAGIVAGILTVVDGGSLAAAAAFGAAGCATATLVALKMIRFVFEVRP
ncbi:hypothetical protein NONI108955_44580 [Nocardia ninae]|uniref:Uncharacterized protein n=1 Tax=Nocardia ninae NBRC 108245 TaxID=1210091 RepID=A0A511MIT8_9NOCA|nr:hypothetical protein [Nocardia ninae]GEM40543.1 hypothetical protein NN4_50620 [Nocardia ninae NBRC 108245]